jgi:hypothetical protein
MIVNKLEPVEVRTTDGYFVKLWHKPMADAVQLFIGHSSPQGTEIAHVSKDGLLQWDKIKVGDFDVKATIEMNSLLWDCISKALQGVAQPPEQSHIEGELQASKYHLEDLRKLLKLKV